MLDRQATKRKLDMLKDATVGEMSARGEVSEFATKAALPTAEAAEAAEAMAAEAAHAAPGERAAKEFVEDRAETHRKTGDDHDDGRDVNNVAAYARLVLPENRGSLEEGDSRGGGLNGTASLANL